MSAFGEFLQEIKKRLGAVRAVAADCDDGARTGIAVEMSDGARHGVLLTGPRKSFVSMSAVKRERLLKRTIYVFESKIA